MTEDCFCENRNGNEKKLLQLAVPDDRDAIGALFCSSIRQLRGAAARFLREDEDIEDVVQECFLSAWKNLGQFEQRAKLSTWLQSILINRALMELRSRKNKRPFVSLDSSDSSLLDSLRDFSPNPERLYLRKEQRRALQKGVDRLPVFFASVLRTYYFGQCSVKEGAERLGLTTSQFKARLFQGRRKLAKLLCSEYGSRCRSCFTSGARHHQEVLCKR